MGIVNEIKTVVDIIPNGDKLAHFILSMIIAFMFGWLCSIFDVKIVGVIILSFLSAFGIGIGKEFGDLMGTGIWSWWDILADFLGAAIGSLIWLLILA